MKARRQGPNGRVPGPTAQEDEDNALRARFEEACRLAALRHESRLETDRAHARLDEIAADAERLAGQDDLTPDAWATVSREWYGLVPRADNLDATVSERFAVAHGRVLQREEERRAAAERSMRQQVRRVEQLIERVLARAAAEDLTLREADRAVPRCARRSRPRSRSTNASNARCSTA